MKKAIAAILLALVPMVSSAQVVSVQKATLFRNYDVASAVYIYGTYSNDPTINIDPLSDKGMEQLKLVQTTGSSATLTAVTASSAPFTYPLVNDLLIFTLPFTANNNYKQAVAAGAGAGERVERKIITHTSNDVSVVDAVIDLGAAATPGVTFRWKKFITGTAAGSGWIPVRGFKGIQFTATVATINATSLDFEVSCKYEGGDPNQVFTKNFTSATYPANGTAVAIAAEYAQYDFCRAGWKINTDTGVQSVSTAVEVTR